MASSRNETSDGGTHADDDGDVKKDDDDDTFTKGRLDVDGSECFVSLNKTNNVWNLQCNDKTIYLPEKLRDCSKLKITKDFILTPDDNDDAMYSLQMKDGFVYVENISEGTIVLNINDETCDIVVDAPENMNVLTTENLESTTPESMKVYETRNSSSSRRENGNVTTHRNLAITPPGNRTDATTGITTSTPGNVTDATSGITTSTLGNVTDATTGIMSSTPGNVTDATSGITTSTPGNVTEATSGITTSTPGNVTDATSGITTSTPGNVTNATTGIMSSTPGNVTNVTTGVRSSTHGNVTDATTGLMSSTPGNVTDATTGITTSTPGNVTDATSGITTSTPGNVTDATSGITTSTPGNVTDATSGITTSTPGNVTNATTGITTSTPGNVTNASTGIMSSKSPGNMEVATIGNLSSSQPKSLTVPLSPSKTYTDSPPVNSKDVSPSNMTDAPNGCQTQRCQHEGGVFDNLPPSPALVPEEHTFTMTNQKTHPDVHVPAPNKPVPLPRTSKTEGAKIKNAQESVENQIRKSAATPHQPLVQGAEGFIEKTQQIKETQQQSKENKGESGELDARIGPKTLSREPLVPGADCLTETDSQLNKGTLGTDVIFDKEINKKLVEDACSTNMDRETADSKPQRPPRRRENTNNAQESVENQVRKSAATPHQPLVQGAEGFIEKTQQIKETQQNERELHVTLKYQRVKEFNTDASIPCTHDTFMRCRYVMGNPKMFNTIRKHLKGKNISEISTEDNDGDIWLMIDIGKVTQTPTGLGEMSRDLAIEKIIQETDNLIINSFQPTGIDKHEAARLMMKHSKEEMGNELWLYVDDMSGCIHYVYPNDRGKKVEDTIYNVVGMLMKAEKSMILELVFSKVFGHFNVKQTLKKKYEEKVMWAIDCMETTNTCKVTLNGRMSELESAEKLINTNYVDPYVVNSISVSDINELKTANLNIDHVVRDALSQDELGDVFWYVNSTFGKIEVCSKSTAKSDKAVNCLKTCLKQIEMPLDNFAKLEMMSEVIEGRAFVQKQKGTVKVLGTNAVLQNIKQHLVDLDKNVKRVHQRGGKEHCGKESLASIKRLDEKDKDNQMHVITQKTGFIVENVNDFKMLCSSQELKDFALQNDVELTKTPREQNHGFLLSGLASNCLKVKEKLTQMIQDNTPRVQEKHWKLDNGHCVTVHLSTSIQEEVDILVQVKTVKPDEAGFDNNSKLCLPQWIDGLKQEKDYTRQSVKDLLMSCFTKGYYRVKIEMIKLEGPIIKQFTYGIFEVLYGGDLERKKPLTIFICTDHEMFKPVCDFCETCFTMYLTKRKCETEDGKDSPHVMQEKTIGEHDATKSCLEVSVIAGQLNGTKADVLVNTTSKDLQLNVGKVSAALLSSAGPKLQEEITRNRPSGIAFGEIVKTRGYNLQGCQYVLHGALDFYKSTKTVNVLQKFVYDCLMEADTLKCGSIAFPAIGTGNLGYPRDKVAEAMYGAVRDFEDRRRFVKEVKFVIYYRDTETIEEFRKQEDIYAEYSKSYSQEFETFGHVRVAIKQGKLLDIRTEGIIYVWEMQSSFSVKVRDHELLKHIGTKLQHSWTNHRDNKATREQSLETSAGGSLNVSRIIHVFSADNMTSLQDALLEGLRRADDMVSVAVFFSEKSKFLKYSTLLIDAFVASVMDIKTNKSSLQNIHVVIESERTELVQRLKTRLQDSTVQKVNVATGGGSTCGTGIASRSPREPQPQSIRDRGDRQVNLSQQQDWEREKQHLSTDTPKDPKFDFYVLIDKIPQNITEGKLKETISEYFPKTQFNLIFIPGRKEAILKCETKADAKTIISLGSTKDCLFKELPTQSMVEFEVVEIKDPKATKYLETMGNSTTSSILAPTKYQLDYALQSLEFGSGSKHRGDSEGFNEVECCTRDVWDIIETMKAKEIEVLKQQGLQIDYSEGFLQISGLKSQTDESCITVLKSCIKELQVKEIVEITMNEPNTDKIKTLCHEVEIEQKMQCCVFVEKRNIVLTFGDTYDIVQRIKHQILVKDGQVKLTGRRRRDFKNTDEKVTEFIQNVIDEPREVISDSRTDPVEDRDRWPAVKRSRVKENNPEFDLKRQAKHIQTYNTDENMAVYVYEANILKLPVDCIVNAANKSLQHGGGVARVIAQAAGRRLDQEGSDYISKNGEVPVGQMCVTTAGKLHYDCVIHAVGPCWSDYYPHSLQDVQQCENHLYSALMESFQAAEDRGLESIALPAISAAIFAVPEELCVYHYAKATLDYSRKKSPNALKEIHFIDINPRIVSSIQKMFTSMLTHGNYPYYSTEKFVKTKKTNKPYEPKSSENHDFGNKASSDRFALVYYKSGESHVFESERCTLCIQSGDLMKIKAAAIVSLEDMGGSGKGQIAKHITEQISSRNRSNFNRDKKEFFRKYPKPGDVHVTWGYDSGYQYVLHAVLPYDIRNESPENKKSVIEQAEQNILKKLTEKYTHSVAMCLIGAGSESRDDVRIAADAFLHVYRKYCQEKGTRRSTPLHITLVCRDNTMLSNVIEKFGEYGLLGDTKPAAPAVPPRPARSPDLLKKKPESPDSLESCVICMEKITDRKVLKCGHAFDKDCIDQAFKVKKVCPTCGALCGKLTGDQPVGGRSTKIEPWNHCAGFDNCGRIAITYTFPSGLQGSDHPNPGKPYTGITRTGYLPDTTEGREVLEMLEIAFDRKLTFTIGTSRTTGEEGVITWNDIHHKTDPKPYTQFGYPDPTYLDRVKDELSAKGITVKDIKKKKKSK